MKTSFSKHYLLLVILLVILRSRIIHLFSPPTKLCRILLTSSNSFYFKTEHLWILILSCTPDFYNLYTDCNMKTIVHFGWKIHYQYQEADQNVFEVEVAVFFVLSLLSKMKKGVQILSSLLPD